TYGIGYGLHFGLLYENKTYAFKMQFLVNDLFSRTHWNNLPYSLVHIKTENQIIGDNGYVEYDPTISGWELYKDYKQIIEAKYHIDISKQFDFGYEVEIGLDSMDYLHMPYVSIAKEFDEKRVKILYEHRFHSIGASYEDKNFNISVLSNGFAQASAIGISGSYLYRF
ncbi:MAG: hypothetical protein DRG09_04680, partial [Epsilonproteobacteria bacterium]